MKNVTSHTGKLEIIERLPSSRNGNPRWLLKIDDWTCRTAVDAMIGYGVTNFDGKIVKADIGTYRGNATVEYVKLA